MGNISSVSTTLQAGTDIQHFCYDEQNRLISASANGTTSCGTFTAGTLTSAQYQQSDTYDTNGRLMTSSQGSYTYGDSHHLHVVTSTGSGYILILLPFIETMAQPAVLPSMRLYRH